MKLWKKTSLFILFFILCERFCYTQTEGFTPSKIIAAGSEKSDVLENQAVFSRPFYFLGSGKQFYAFESEDGTVVIKFIKQSRRKPIPWLAKLPLPKPVSHLRDAYLQKREKRLVDLVESCRLASVELAQETGIISTHLVISKPSLTITLFDKLGIAHRVELGATQFLLQKKATLLTHLSKNSIDEMIKLTKDLSCKGIINLDPMIQRNFGLCENKMIALDFGSLKKDQKSASFPGFQRAVFLQLLSLREYLQNNQPQDVAYFDEQIQKTLQTTT